MDANNGTQFLSKLVNLVRAAGSIEIEGYSVDEFGCPEQGLFVATTSNDDVYEFDMNQVVVVGQVGPGMAKVKATDGEEYIMSFAVTRMISAGDVESVRLVG